MKTYLQIVRKKSASEWGQYYSICFTLVSDFTCLLIAQLLANIRSEEGDGSENGQSSSRQFQLTYFRDFEDPTTRTATRTTKNNRFYKQIKLTTLLVHHPFFYTSLPVFGRLRRENA